MIIVFGDINIHIRAPLPGGFLHPGTYNESPHGRIEIGGSGALHAISAARAGAKVALAGAIGNDLFAQHSLNTLRKEGIGTSAITRHDTDTGFEITLKSAPAVPSVIATPGANLRRHAMQIPDMHLNIRTLLLLPVQSNGRHDDALSALITRAKEGDTRCILSLTHGCTTLPPGVEQADILITDDTPDLIGQSRYTLVTQNAGIQGARIYEDETLRHEYTCPVPGGAIDQTACFDVFCGFFASGIQAGLPLERAIALATQAARATAQEEGGYCAVPYLGNLENTDEITAERQTHPSDSRCHA